MHGLDRHGESSCKQLHCMRLAVEHCTTQQGDPICHTMLMRKVCLQILILLISYALLSIRAATGCVALYSEQEKYAKW